MDKQMIEEMAKDVAFAGQIAGDWLMEESRKLLQEKGRFKSTEHTKTLSDIVAEELAKMGYRKIPEGAVVLTREEYEKLEALKGDYVKGYEAGVDEGWDVASHVTAEKFAERLKDEVLNYCGTPEEMWLFEAGKIIFCQDIDEICNEIIGGKDDDTSQVGK